MIPLSSKEQQILFDLLTPTPTLSLRWAAVAVAFFAGLPLAVVTVLSGGPEGWREAPIYYGALFAGIVVFLALLTAVRFTQRYRAPHQVLRIEAGALGLFWGGIFALNFQAFFTMPIYLVFFILFFGMIIGVSAVPRLTLAHKLARLTSAECNALTQRLMGDPESRNTAKEP
ncbi:MAG: hypothetical protein ACLFTT_18425 [Candidatus Hydrogenedentota bacterium]